MTMPKHYIAFTCSHKTMIQKQLEDYAEMLTKKYERMTSVIKDGVLKIHVSGVDETFKIALNGLRDNGFIFNSKSYLELHRSYVISKVVDVKRLIVGVLRAQVQNNLINKNYYNSDHQIFDNASIKSLGSANDMDEFSKIYLGLDLKGEIEDEEGIKSHLEEKGIRMNAWLDMIPVLRSYYKIKYESVDEPASGKDTFFLHLPILSKDDDSTKSVEYSTLAIRVNTLMKSMNAITGS